MKSLLLSVVLTLLLSGFCSAEQMGPPAPAQVSHETELAAAEAYLYGGRFKAEDINYIRFFTTFAIPEKIIVRDKLVNLREQGELCLPFILNSCANYHTEGYIERAKRVPSRDTLWWIDIRDYGWSIDDIDTVFKIQPYFLTPLVSGKNPAIMFRADWFIVNAMDTTKQNDRGLKDLVYYVLLYGRGHEPKDANEFRKLWGVDIDTIRSFKLETGTIVDAGDSGVSKHTRQLRRGRTIFGYYWETRDVKSHDFDPEKIKSRDYIEDIFAKQADAAEYITSHKNGLQVYLLTNGNNGGFKRIEDGDVGVVVDRQDPHDPRVRTAKGCVVCHSNGIIPYTNAIKDIFRKGGDIFAASKELQRELKAFYLKFAGEEVDADSLIFAKAVKDCNGLDPLTNAEYYHNVYSWYWNNKVELDQAAIECGLTVESLKEVLKGSVTGRLVQLYHGRGMPREIWDSVNVGGYVQTILLLKKIKPEDIQAEKPKESYPATVEVIVQRASLLNSHNQITVYFGLGSRLPVVGVYDAEWYYIKTNSHEGYIRKSETKPVTQ